MMAAQMPFIQLGHALIYRAAASRRAARRRRRARRLVGDVGGRRRPGSSAAQVFVAVAQRRSAPCCRACWAARCWRRARAAGPGTGLTSYWFAPLPPPTAPTERPLPSRFSLTAGADRAAAAHPRAPARRRGGRSRRRRRRLRDHLRPLCRRRRLHARECDGRRRHGAALRRRRPDRPAGEQPAHRERVALGHAAQPAARDPARGAPDEPRRGHPVRAPHLARRPERPAGGRIRPAQHRQRDAADAQGLARRGRRALSRRLGVGLLFGQLDRAARRRGHAGHDGGRCRAHLLWLRPRLRADVLRARAVRRAAAPRPGRSRRPMPPPAR